MRADGLFDGSGGVATELGPLNARLKREHEHVTACSSYYQEPERLVRCEYPSTRLR